MKVAKEAEEEGRRRRIRYERSNEERNKEVYDAQLARPRKRRKGEIEIRRQEQSRCCETFTTALVVLVILVIVYDLGLSSRDRSVSIPGY